MVFILIIVIIIIVIVGCTAGMGYAHPAASAKDRASAAGWAHDVAVLGV